MCQKLLYPYSQTSEGILHVQPEGCFQVRFLGESQGMCFGEGRVWPFVQGGLGRWWHFFSHKILSLSGHAVGHGEKLCTIVWGQGLSFLTLPVTLLVADLWNSMLQGSTDTKCLVILQEKPDLFPWWKLSEWDKKISPPNRQMPLSSKERGSAQADLDQELDLSLKWLCSDLLWGSHTQVCSIRSQAHLREDTTVWESGEGCWKEKILSHSHCREELITTA